ncbi:hypothetical protein DYY67_1653 [Candidatus Nitrosotalea sp. TS]|nr:hypothetical protein [Candidatus Nitrosotalea sp. TS]
MKTFAKERGIKFTYLVDETAGSCKKIRRSLHSRPVSL